MPFLIGYNEEGQPIYSENAPSQTSNSDEGPSNPLVAAEFARQQAAATANQRTVNGQTFIAVPEGHPLYGMGQMYQGEMLVPWDTAVQYAKSQKRSFAFDPLSNAVFGKGPEFTLDQAPIMAGAALLGGAALGGLPAEGAVGAKGVAALPESYWGMTASAAPASDAAIGAGTVGEAPFIGSTGPGVTEAGYNWLNTPSATGGFTGAGLAGAPGTGTALSRLLGLGQTGSDLLSVGGAIAPGILGYLGADKQSDAFRDVSNQFSNIGAPFRGRLEESYGPGFDLASQPGYGDAFNRMADISARSYSSKFGNPADSPTAQGGILSDVWNQSYLPALSNYRGQLGQFGGLGLNTSGQASLGGASIAGGGIDAIGLGLGRAMNPQPSLEELLRQYGSTGRNNSINVGGMRL